MWFSGAFARLASFGGPRSKERLGVGMCAYAHRLGLVYIYTNIRTAVLANFGSFGGFASLGGPRLLGGGDAHGMRIGAD